MLHNLKNKNQLLFYKEINSYLKIYLVKKCV